MTYADTKKGEVIGGFKCIGHTRNTLWGQFRLDNFQEWTDQQRQDWQRENQRRQQQKAKEDEVRHRRSLSVVERDKQYRALLAQLKLHPDDKADLVRRGFTCQQIELSGFKSVESYQKLQSEFSELLPGIGTGGKSLLISNSGYLCPVRNVDGLIVACQVRLRALPTGESNRYRWLSTKEQSLHLYPESCVKGELPLAVFRPQGKPQGISLVEGTGAKPFLVSQRLNQIVIGAAGGQFASSETTVKRSLDQVSLELDGCKVITICPDAGDVVNLQVMARWKNTIALLEKWGWSVQVAWWGQIDKSHPDIDELKGFSKIQLITPKQFADLSAQKIKEESERKKLEDWRAKAREEWRKNRKFNASFITNTQWCDWEKPADNSIFFGKAGLGRGKTTLLRRWVKTWKEQGVAGFICLGYRNTLLLQLCANENDGGLGFYHLHEHDGLMFRSANNEGIALCVDSLWRLNPDDFDEKIIILDEFKSVLKHLLHSPTVKHRDKILDLFGEAIRRSKQVICLDGLMTDWCVEYLKSIAPDKKIITAENTHQGKKPVINFLLGTVDAKTRLIKINDRSPLLHFLLEESEIPVVCSDSQVFIEALDNLFTERELKVLRIDSKTVPEAYVKEFLANCNAYIEKHRPDVLLYTPSAESGVDVSIPDYFTHHFGFFFGVLGIDGILQMLGRIRDDIPKFVWCKSFVEEDEKQHSKSPFADIVHKSINKLLVDTIGVSITDQEEVLTEKVVKHLETVIENSNDTNLKVSCLIKSIENHEKSNLRECLKEALIESGHRLKEFTLKNEVDADKETKNEVKAVKRQNARDIFNAEKIAPELVDDLGSDASWEERCKVMQAKLRERLPGIDETSTWTEEFIHRVKYDDINFIEHQEMYCFFHHPDFAKHEAQKRLHWMARRSKTFIGNIKIRWAKIHALHEMNFGKFLDPKAEWSDDSPEVVELVRQGKKHSNALGRKPGKQSNIQYLSKLLNLLGLKLISRKEGGKRFYHLDDTILNDPTRLQVLACVEARFLDQPTEALDWESAIDEAYGIPPKTEFGTQEALQETAQNTPTEIDEITEEEKEDIADVASLLPLVQTKEDYEDIFSSVKPQVLGKAWEKISEEDRQRILKLCEPKSFLSQLKVGNILKSASDSVKKVAQILNIFDTWVETSLGKISFAEIESGQWSASG